MTTMISFNGIKIALAEDTDISNWDSKFSKILNMF